MLSPDEITAYVHEQIPITEGMGIAIVEFTGSSIRATAPLEPNINHRQSAFGGSIATLGILTGWAVIWSNLTMNNRTTNLVIHHSETEFGRPGTAEIESTSRPLLEPAWNEFFGALDRFGKARIMVTSDIFSDGKLIATNTGQFVAIASDE